MAVPSSNDAVEFVCVINSFNRQPLLEKALSSLTQALRAALFRSAIVVFEAGSTDGSREFLRKWQIENPGDFLTIAEPNAGRSTFSDGVNQGCATALASHPQCRWLFLYETDNWIANPVPLTQAIRLLEANPELAAAGFTVRLHSGPSCGYGISFPTTWSLAAGQNLCALWHLTQPNDTPWQQMREFRWRTCDVVFTSPLLIRRQAWEQTGGFDAENFPFSDSDLDWAWRCNQLGWQTAVIDSGEVVHDNLEQASVWSANRVIDFHRSRLRLLKRHRGVLAGWIKPLLAIRHALESLALTRSAKNNPESAVKLQKRREMLRTVWSDYVS